MPQKSTFSDLERYRKAIGQHQLQVNSQNKKPPNNLFDISNFSIVEYSAPQKYRTPNFNAGLSYMAGLALYNISQHKDIGKNLGIFALCCSILTPSLLHSVMAEGMKDFSSNATSLTNQFILPHASGESLWEIDQHILVKSDDPSFQPAKQIKTEMVEKEPGKKKAIEQKSSNPVAKSNQYVFYYQPQKMIVDATPNFKDYIQKKLADNKTKEEGKALEKELAKLTELIKQQISRLPFPSELLNRLQESGLAIFIEHPSNLATHLGNANLYGFAIPSTKQVLLRFEENYTPEQVNSILLNQFHHMAVADTNRRNVSADIAAKLKNNLAKPFLNKEGIIHNERLTQLKAAIEEFVQNIAKLKDIKLKNQTLVKKLRQAVIRYYQPVIYRRPASDGKYIEDYKNGILKAGKILELEGSEKFKVIDILPHDLYGVPLGYSGNQGIIVKYSINVPDTNEGKVHAFIHDMSHITNMFGLTPGESIFGLIYSNQSEERRIAELSSDIEKLPNEIKQILCPEWCKYFAHLHNVKNYCGTSYKPGFIS